MSKPDGEIKTKIGALLTSDATKRSDSLLKISVDSPLSRNVDSFVACGINNRPILTSDLNSVTSNILVCMCMLLLRWPLRPWWLPKDLGGQM